jgi:hypothetical protein
LIAFVLTKTLLRNSLEVFSGEGAPCQQFYQARPYP